MKLDRCFHCIYWSVQTPLRLESSQALQYLASERLISFAEPVRGLTSQDSTSQYVSPFYELRLIVIIVFRGPTAKEFRGVVIHPLKQTPILAGVNLESYVYITRILWCIQIYKYQSTRSFGAMRSCSFSSS